MSDIVTRQPSREIVTKHFAELDLDIRISLRELNGQCFALIESQEYQGPWQDLGEFDLNDLNQFISILLFTRRHMNGT